MSEMAKAARAAMKKKAEGLTKTDPHQKVDSSDWTPPEPINAEAKTGMRPVSRRAFKAGGKVEGKKAEARADRKPRASGGKSFANAMINRNAKAANEERDGVKHVGGMKKGGRAEKCDGGMIDKKTGRAKKFMGGPMLQPNGMIAGAAPAAGGSVAPEMVNGDPREAMVPKGRFNFGVGASGHPYKKGGAVKHEDEKADKALVRKMVKKEALTGKKEGGKIEKVMHEFKEGELHSGSKKGPEVKNRKQAIAIALSEARKARQSGGRAKGKTNVNIIIAAGGRQAPAEGPMAPTMPPKPAAQPVPVPPPSPAAPAPAVMPVAMPPASAGGPPPMGRKSGGRTFTSFKDMKAGSGSAEGRLEKTEIAEHKRMQRKDGGHVYPKMKYGAGSGEGRMEKTDKYGLSGPSKSR